MGYSTPRRESVLKKMLAMSALSFAARHSIHRLSTPNGRLKFLVCSFVSDIWMMKGTGVAGT